MRAYLPIEWDFGEGRRGDGLTGETVTDGGVIYFYDNDEESVNFEKVLLKTSIRELVNDVIDGHTGPIGNLDSEIIGILARIRGALIEASNDLTKVIEANQ